MLFPVIMCGGAGARLWPASQPDRPKPFVPLLDGRTLFDLTLDRVKALTDAAPPIVIAGARHARLIGEALAAAGLAGTIVVEPEARDSAAAMAAAAELVAARDPNGLCLFLAADHLIHDHAGFAASAGLAALAAGQAHIVTLGVRPTGPSSAYGYIRPGAAGPGQAFVVDAFVEKPSREIAEGYVAAGYLWNSGMFIASAAALAAELNKHAPEVLAAAAEGVRDARLEGGVLFLADGFRRSPKISIDYAVMERTDRALVVPAGFDWSDLGAWNNILDAASGDANGNALIGRAASDGARGNLVIAGEGASVALRGVENLAVVVDGQNVMVCGLDVADDVKRLVEAVQTLNPPPRTGLDAWARRYHDWFYASALPLWWSLGADHERGGFHEVVALDGGAVATARRMRVQPRQTHVFARAGLSGWSGPWKQAVAHGLTALDSWYRREDGLYRTLVDQDGAPTDNTAKLYDQAFMLLALAGARSAGIEPERAEAIATDLLAQVEKAFGHEAGFKEADERAFQSNPHMHLFEAALAWIEAGGDARWSELAGRLADLCQDRFIDAEGGYLREFFDADWAPASGPDGEVVEPGHQFEWAWLLARWSRISGSPTALDAARRLYAAGARGIDPVRGVAIDELDTRLSPARRTARLWPQTERVKAAALLFKLTGEAAFEGDAEAAAAGLWLYLEGRTPGLYGDKMDALGRFVIEPSPASSLYHLQGAVEALAGWRA